MARSPAPHLSDVFAVARGDQGAAKESEREGGKKFKWRDGEHHWPPETGSSGRDCLDGAALASRAQASDIGLKNLSMRSTSGNGVRYRANLRAVEVASDVSLPPFL